MTKPTDLSVAAEVRCGDADRERVAERLRTAAAEGRLTMEELDERLAGAYAARFGPDLEVLTRDLPRSADRAGGWRAILTMLWIQLSVQWSTRRRVIIAGLSVLLLVLGGVSAVDGLEDIVDAD